MKKTDKIQLASTNQCTGCAACASVCPTQSITMREDKEGFLQPHIDADTCIKCHKCEKTCPIVTPISIPTDFETQAFAAINKNESVRMRSSSGGIFYALAKWTIEQGGVVFGARFNENWEVVHGYTETIEGIEPLMRSKYVQSRIGDAYKKAKKFLKTGRQVLFVGTPCQIGGFKAYIGKDYDNLFTVDLVCHGIPSPKVWKEYLKTFNDSTITSIDFKDKFEGWLPEQCHVTIKTLKATEHLKQMENQYYRCYRNGLIMRHSCYQCNFRNMHRISDMTISDYWGVEDKCPSMFDNKGTSLVIVRSKQAHKWLNKKSDLILQKIDFNGIAVGDKSPNANPQQSPFERFLLYKTLAFLSFNQSMKIVDCSAKWHRRYNKYIGKMIPNNK